MRTAAELFFLSLFLLSYSPFSVKVEKKSHTRICQKYALLLSCEDNYVKLAW